MPEPPAGRGPLVFLSYASEDEPYARELKLELVRHGARVWEPENLSRVARNLRGLEEAIRRADAFVILVSRASADSSWVQMEIEAALRAMGPGGQRRIVPVILDGTGPPEALRGSQAIFVRNGNWTEVAANLIEAKSEIVEADFWQEVLDRLQELGLDMEVGPILGGVRPDFAIHHGDRTMILEVKPWSSPGILDETHAVDQIALLAEAVEADRALVVVPEIRSAAPDPAVVSLAQLPEKIEEWRQPRGGVAREAQKELSEPEQIFAAMPFATEYSDTYWVAMREAALAVGAGCVRIDKTDYVGDVVEKIKGTIEESAAVIADLSESGPNVLFELGFAFALGKPCILICSSPLDELPFDIRNQRIIQYLLGQTYQLKEELVRALKAVL